MRVEYEYITVYKLLFLSLYTMTSPMLKALNFWYVLCGMELYDKQLAAVDCNAVGSGTAQMILR